VGCRAGTRERQVEIFWQEADFGYVDERLKELTVLCEPQNAVRQSLSQFDALSCESWGKR